MLSKVPVPVQHEAVDHMMRMSVVDIGHPLLLK